MTKKLCTLLVLFTTIAGLGQNKVAKKVNELLRQKATFQQVTLLDASDNIATPALRKAVNKATYAKINTAALASAMAGKHDAIELRLPVGNEFVLLQLYRVNPFAQGFRIDTDKAANVQYQPGLYYRGIIKGDSKSVASFSFFDNEISGLVSSHTLHNLVVGKLKGSPEYIIYTDTELSAKNNFSCQTTFKPRFGISKKTESREIQSDKCVTMFYELRHSLYVEMATALRPRPIG